MSIGKLLFSFDGRINRLKYLIVLLPMNFIFVILSSIGKYNPDIDIVFAPIYLLFAYIDFALIIKRLHDVNKSGWLSLLSFIPLINLFLGLYLLFVKGTMGANQYGEDPLNPNFNKELEDGNNI